MEYETAHIRRFLDETFTDQSLKSFCREYFRPVYYQFKVGMTKRRKIQILLGYAEKHSIKPHLFKAIENVKPHQFAQQFPHVPSQKTDTEVYRTKRNPRQVFISHTTRDAKFAHQLAKDLIAYGWPVWIAPNNIRPGEKWVRAIERGLDQSGIAVLVLTPDALKSRWVETEIHTAIDREHQRKMRLIPLLAQRTNVPSLLNEYQRISFVESYENGLKKLLDELEGKRQPQASPSQFTLRSRGRTTEEVEKKASRRKREKATEDNTLHAKIEGPKESYESISFDMKKPFRFLIVCGGAGIGLLGHRKILGLDGELHIDVSRGIDDSLSLSDERSVSIKLDRSSSLGTSSQLLLHMQERIGKTAKFKTHRRHTNLLSKNLTFALSLAEGLARSPALGGLAIRHENNLRELEARLRVMFDEWAGPSNPVEVWIVSSTAGGTGEGIHRFIAEKIVSLLSSKPGARVKLNFLQIGSLTYKAIDPERTALNTFLGIAADAAFKIKLAKDNPRIAVASNWFFLEVPPVGVGQAAVPIRAKMIELAGMAIMCEELQSDINMITVNDGIGLVRVGYWAEDFEEKALYAEMLRQLVAKLQDLIAPSEYAKDVQGKISFEPGEIMQKVRYSVEDGNLLYEKMEKRGWQFPRYFPSNKPQQREYVFALAEQWKSAIDQLIAPLRLDEVDTQFLIERIRISDGSEVAMRQPLVVPSGTDIPYSPGWFERIDVAQQVKAWTSLLLGDGRGEGLLAKLVALAEECSRVQHPSVLERLSVSPRQKAHYLCSLLWNFVETLVQVIRLEQLGTAAQTFLDEALKDVRRILDFAERELVVIHATLGKFQGTPIIVADLSDRVDQLTNDTWLKTLDSAVRHQDLQMFRRQVFRGVSGLTGIGLLRILGLSDMADTEQIKGTLRATVGQMRDSDGVEFEAQWWGGTSPAGTRRVIKYRILPKLEAHVRAELGDGDREIKYLYATLGLLGLNILAFEAVTIADHGDTVTTPAYLLHPFVPIVKRYLDDWLNKRPGRPSAKLSLVSAGAGGESLYKPALLEVGLEPEELKKLSEFYDLYDPADDEAKNNDG